MPDKEPESIKWRPSFSLLAPKIKICRACQVPGTGASACGQAKENLGLKEGGAAAKADRWSLGPTATVTMGEPALAMAVMSCACARNKEVTS